MSTTNFTNDPEATPSSPKGSAGVKDQAQQAAGTAADEGKRVAGVAQEEVKNVTSEASTQLRGLLSQATSQVDDQSRTQKERLAEAVRTFGSDLEAMKSGGFDEGSGGLAAQIVQQVAEQARGLASHLDDREPRELLDDVRRFARRRPAAFLLGAMVAGVAAGRVTRGAKAAQDSSDGTSSVTTQSDSTPPYAVQATTPGSQISAPVTAPVAPPVTVVGGAPDSALDESVLTGAEHVHTEHVHTETDLGAQGIGLPDSGVPGRSGGPV